MNEFEIYESEKRNLHDTIRLGNVEGVGERRGSKTDSDSNSNRRDHDDYR